MSVFHLLFFRCHSVSPKWGFHKRFRCPITLPNRLAQLDVLLLCNHIVHYIRLSFRFQSSLPRGERLRYGTRCRICYDFNPRSREGSDEESWLKMAKMANFNPRFREGSDERLMSEERWMVDFNPRSREGSDSIISMIIFIIYISIRAPARGATFIAKAKRLTEEISIRAPARGATYTGQCCI